MCTVMNVVLLVAECPIRQVRHTRISQYLYLKEYSLIHRSSVRRIIRDLFRATNPEENNVPLWLLMYSR